MALGLQGISKSDIELGLVTKIEIRQQGTGSFLDVGRFRGLRLVVTPISEPGDPSDTMHVYAMEYRVAFDLFQTDVAKELTLLAGTAGTGLYETDVEVKLTYLSGRTITLGAVTASPLRLVPRLSGEDEDDPLIIPCEGQNIEPITTFVAKWA